MFGLLEVINLNKVFGRFDYIRGVRKEEKLYMENLSLNDQKNRGRIVYQKSRSYTEGLVLDMVSLRR